MNVLGSIFLNSRKDRRKDVKTERRRFFVRYRIVMVLSNCSFFQYCYVFSIAHCTIIALNLLCFIFGISSLLLFINALLTVITLPTILQLAAIAFENKNSLKSDAYKAKKTIHITQKRSHENDAKRLNAPTFAIAQLEQQ